MFEISTEQIGALAEAYDQHANALDPQAPAVAEAERVFHQSLAVLYEGYLYEARQKHVREGGHPDLFTPQLSPRDFRLGIIRKCKEYLKAQRQKG